MIAGPARSLPFLRSARPALRRAARLALMLGPMIGPLVGTTAQAAVPVAGVPAAPWEWAIGDEPAPLRRGAFSPVGSEPRPTVGRRVGGDARGDGDARSETAERRSRNRPHPSVRRRPAAIEWGWASRGWVGGASGAADRGRGRPAAAVARRGARRPRRPAGAGGPGPAAGRSRRWFRRRPRDHVRSEGEAGPADRRSSGVAREASGATGAAGPVGGRAECRAGGGPGEQASAAALLRFLSATEPGTWAAPAARTAELNRATGTIRR